jgi:hypothetical protein
LSTEWVLIMYWCRYVKCSLLRKEDGLRLILYECCSWKMAVNLTSTL